MVAAGETFVKQIKGIKQFVKDGEGQLLKTEDGKYVVEVAYVDEVGKNQTMHAAAEEMDEVIDIDINVEKLLRKSWMIYSLKYLETLHLIMHPIR